MIGVQDAAFAFITGRTPADEEEAEEEGEEAAEEAEMTLAFVVVVASTPVCSLDFALIAVVLGSRVGL